MRIDSIKLSNYASRIGHWGAAGMNVCKTSELLQESVSLRDLVFTHKWSLHPEYEAGMRHCDRRDDQQSGVSCIQSHFSLSGSVSAIDKVKISLSASFSFMGCCKYRCHGHWWVWYRLRSVAVLSLSSLSLYLSLSLSALLHSISIQE